MQIPNNHLLKSDNCIDTLFDLIKENKDPKEIIENNIDICKYFYNNRYTLIRSNLLNKKLFTIIEFLIRNDSNQIFPYLQSNLLDTLIREQELLCFHLRNQKTDGTTNLNHLLENLTYYENFCTFLNNNLQTKDSITHNSYQKYQNSKLKLDTIEALIINIHDNFFDIPPKTINNVVAYIEKEIIHILSKNNPKESLYLNLVYQYFEKLLPIKQFIGKNLNEDIVIQNILNGTLQEKRIINKLFDTLKIEKIMELFHQNIVEFLSFLDNLEPKDDVYKQLLMNKLAQKLLTPENFHYLLPLITQNSQNKFWKNYLNKLEYEKIINFSLGENPSQLDFETINYLLNNHYVNNLFLANLGQLLQQKNTSFTKEQQKTIEENFNKNLGKFNLGSLEELKKLEITSTDSLETKKIKTQKYNLIGRTIDFEIALELLRNYLQKNITLEEECIQAIVKSIIKNMLASLEIEENGVYFVKYQNYNGEYRDEEKTICINKNLIDNLTNKNNSLYHRLHIFATIFHEMKHAKQNQAMNLRQLDFETYEMQKEEYLIKYDSNYYITNYLNVKREIDARIEGYHMLSKFIETYFKEVLTPIQDAIIKDLEKELSLKEKKTQKDTILIATNLQIEFSKAFDRLIKYNPMIIKEYPIFTLEYHEDGTPKTIEEISLKQTKENQKLIEEIIQKRISCSNSTQEQLEKHNQRK